MFTGLVEEVGTVVAVRPRDHGAELQIAAPGTAKHSNPGESIAVNGCCLTLTSCRSDCLSFALLEETIARTNVNDLRQNSPVNLERALRAIPMGDVDAGLLMEWRSNVWASLSWTMRMR